MMKDFAPILAGSPPALILAVGLYKSIATALGIEGITLLVFIPGIFAALGMSGMIWTEVTTYKTAARAFALKSWGVFWIAMVGVVALSAFVLFAVYTGQDTKSLFTSTVAMLVGYVIIGANEYMATQKSQAQKAQADEASKNDQQIRLLQAQTEAAAATAKAEADRLNAERLLQNSRNRGAASGGRAATVRPDKSDNRTPALDPEKVKSLAAWLKAHPEAKSLRDVAESGIIGKSQAGPYIRAAQDLNQKAVQP